MLDDVLNNTSLVLLVRYRGAALPDTDEQRKWLDRLGIKTGST
jgi:hypothetical protein